MQPSKSGFTLVELLIVIVVIGILAAITLVAYNGVQSNAQDAAIRSANTQFVQALQQYDALYGQPPSGFGSGSSGAISGGQCPGTTANSGWAETGTYPCTISDILISQNLLPATFFTSLPNNPNYAAKSPKYVFMFYPCTSGTSNQFMLMYSVANPTSAEVSNFNTVMTGCGVTTPTASQQYTSWGMRAATLITF